MTATESSENDAFRHTIKGRGGARWGVIKEKRGTGWSVSKEKRDARCGREQGEARRAVRA